MLLGCFFKAQVCSNEKKKKKGIFYCFFSATLEPGIVFTLLFRLEMQTIDAIKDVECMDYCTNTDTHTHINLYSLACATAKLFLSWISTPKPVIVNKRLFANVSYEK